YHFDQQLILRPTPKANKEIRKHCLSFLNLLQLWDDSSIHKNKAACTRAIYDSLMESYLPVRLPARFRRLFLRNSSRLAQILLENLRQVNPESLLDFTARVLTASNDAMPLSSVLDHRDITIKKLVFFAPSLVTGVFLKACFDATITANADKTMIP